MARRFRCRQKGRCAGREEARSEDPALRPKRTTTLGSKGFAACIDSLCVAAGSVTATAAEKPGGDLTVRIALVG